MRPLSPPQQRQGTKESSRTGGRAWVCRRRLPQARPLRQGLSQRQTQARHPRRSVLLRPQSLDRVPSAGRAGGNEAGDEREQHGDADEHEGACPRQAHDVGHLVSLKHVGIHREAHDHHDQDGKDARDQALDEGLGVEDALDVALGRADGAQDADLLLALQDADVGDDADQVMMPIMMELTTSEMLTKAMSTRLIMFTMSVTEPMMMPM